jgi:HlyD family secretion protein
MTRRVAAIAFGIVVLGVGVAYYRLNATPAPAIITAAVTRGPIVQAVEATGTVQPVDSVEVGAQVTGTIKTLGATFNSEVKDGQVLATLDPASLQAEVDQARASVAHLQAQHLQASVGLQDATVKLARAQQLSKDQLISQADFDAATVAKDAANAALQAAAAQVVQGRAALAQALVNLTHTIIRSPASGIVLARNVEIGQTVTSGLQTPTLFVIARDLATMQVGASVDESDIGNVRAGQPVTFSTDAYGSQVFTGTVTEVRLQPVVTQNVVTYTTMISVPNPGLKLKPGMTATVQIETARTDDTLRVPAAALRFHPDAELFTALGQEIKPGQAGRAGQTGRAGQAGLTGQAGQTGLAGQTGRGRATGALGSHALVWQLVDAKLQPVRVTLGISDGAMVAITTDALQPGATIATGVRTDGASSASAAPTSSPLVPNMGRRRPAPPDTGR